MFRPASSSGIRRAEINLSASPIGKIAVFVLGKTDRRQTGYWYHRELTKCGAVNYVVAPRLLENQRTKRQKTDRLDARALLGNLESYLRGNRDAMSIIAVPSPLQEQQRSVVRYREQLVRNRRRAEARAGR